MANANEKRCEDCTELKMIKGIACCYECFNQPCSEVDDCPLGLTVEDVKDAQTLTKEQKQAEKVMKNSDTHEIKAKRERKPKENVEKNELMAKIVADFGDFDEFNVVNPSREVSFSYKNATFSITLTQKRTKGEKK